MRARRGIIAALVSASVMACAGVGDGPASPGGQGGGGPVGTVAVGSGIRFVSGHNGSMNPAVDTIAVNGTMTWTWSGGLSHSVRSIGTPSFPSSSTRAGTGTYTVTFTTPGTYHYDCIVHGQAMTGTVVVLGAGVADAATVIDPVGDAFVSAGIRWDLVAMTVARDADGITVMLDVSQDIISPMTDGDQGLIAFVDLDLDQNATTGFKPVSDNYRQDLGTAGIGADARVNVSVFAEDGSVAVVNSLAAEVGRVTPVYAGRRLTIRIPKVLIGNDDGFVNATALVGTSFAPSDLVPELGHLTLGGPNAVAASLDLKAALRSAPVFRPWERIVVSK